MVLSDTNRKNGNSHLCPDRPKLDDPVVEREDLKADGGEVERVEEDETNRVCSLRGWRAGLWICRRGCRGPPPGVCQLATFN